LHPRARLSAGYAFGYTFRESAGFRLWVEQFIPDGARTEWWRTDEPAAEGILLREETTPGDPAGTDVTIELSLAPDADVRPAAGRYIDQHGLPIRERLHFTPTSIAGRLAVKDGPQALAMARQIRSAIKRTRNSAATQTVHLFGALPFALAVLIGAQLNTCEPVQCYELNPPENMVYLPSCRLQVGQAT
jgi:hypothetical protein